MTLEFHPVSPTPPARIALFPGAFNPPTIAHLEICRAALHWADLVIWVLPRAFPHKQYAGIPFADRMAFLRKIASREPGFAVAASEGGLYLEIAREARQLLGPGPEIGLLCGRDAAERIAGWDYGGPGVFDKMVADFPLLVASRSGAYEIPGHHEGRVISITLPPSFDDVSSSEVRDRASTGRAWSGLVPPSIQADVAQSLAKYQQTSDQN